MRHYKFHHEKEISERKIRIRKYFIENNIFHLFTRSAFSMKNVNGKKKEYETDVVISLNFRSVFCYNSNESGHFTANNDSIDAHQTAFSPDTMREAHLWKITACGKMQVIKFIASETIQFFNFVSHSFSLILILCVREWE